MRIHLLTIGQSMPAWIQEGFETYTSRMPKFCQLTLTELPSGTHSAKSPVKQAVREEGNRLLAAIPNGSTVTALDVKGKSFDSEALAKQLDQWLQSGKDVSLLIGGPDGLATPCLDRADLTWSLSPLTLPHPLVRVIVAEQLYRAYCILNAHPYHRA